MLTGGDGNGTADLALGEGGGNGTGGGGNGTAAVLLIVGFGCWILEEVVGGTRWSIYLNPFERSSADYLAYGTEVYYSRAYLLVGLGVAILLALLRLRRRECFG